MESQHIIYIFGQCLIVLQAIFFLSMVDAAADMSTTLPPNFVPVIDGAVTERPADLPEILAVPDAKGLICTLASLEATVVIWPEGDESREVRIEMPDRDVNVSTVQNCFNNPSSSVKPLLVVTWSSSFQLCFYISKDETNWNLDQIVFAFNTSEVPLGFAKSELRTFGSEANALSELQAPLGSSYRCLSPKQFSLLPLGGSRVVLGQNKNQNVPDKATLRLDNFQFQPFLGDLKVFGEEVVCREDLITRRHRRRRDSSVTIAVGSSLAVISVVTVMGYAIFRYVKVKAVGYDTMQ
ncbi:uncharacterized protein LOC130686476 [Daphnia carinata]|uniref:uncharacterized protein LOC130686476 n=1 Tax=Daphnia carinata TaxID=120202 RepID=UPI00257AE139|nr:uncharacterized protein LOC130686476 [Daphnia carinata]